MSSGTTTWLIMLEMFLLILLAALAQRYVFGLCFCTSLSLLTKILSPLSWTSSSRSFISLNRLSPFSLNGSISGAASFFNHSSRSESAIWKPSDITLHYFDAFHNLRLASMIFFFLTPRAFCFLPVVFVFCPLTFNP